MDKLKKSLEKIRNKDTNIETVKYVDILDQIETGDLFFTASEKPLSKAIRAFTHSKVSHVGIFHWIPSAVDNIEELYISEALQLFFGHKAHNRLKKTDYFYWGRVPEDFANHRSLDEQNDIIKDMWGSDYDVFGMLYSLIKKNNNNKYFCSEAVATIKGINFPLSQRGITPADLASLCSFIKRVDLTGIK